MKPPTSIAKEEEDEDECNPSCYLILMCPWALPESDEMLVFRIFPEMDFKKVSKVKTMEEAEGLFVCFICQHAFI